MKDIRVIFETWVINYFEGNVNLHRLKGGNYRNYQTHDMWKAFQAGKENK